MEHGVFAPRLAMFSLYSIGVLLAFLLGAASAKAICLGQTCPNEIRAFDNLFGQRWV